MKRECDTKLTPMPDGRRIPEPGRASGRVLGRLFASGFAFRFVTTLAVLAFAASASAENGCPTGMVPTGQPQPGTENSGVFIPMCTAAALPPEQAYEPSPSTPVNYVSSHLAVAWHPDASDVWATWNQRTEAKAQEVALAACNRAMGGGCSIAQSAANSSVAIARDKSDLLWSAWGATPKDAKKAIAKHCASQNVQCKVDRVFTAEPWPEPQSFTDEQRRIIDSTGVMAGHYAPDRIKRHRYAMVAWPRTVPAAPWTDRVWLDSGRQGYAQTERALLERCKRDSGVDCVLGRSVANGLLIHYVRDQGQNMWLSAPSAKEGKTILKKECAKTKSECRIIGSYDAQTPRADVVRLFRVAGGR